MSSMAQQASPIGIGQREFFRIQFIAASTRVKMTFPSIFESYAAGATVVLMMYTLSLEGKPLSARWIVKDFTNLMNLTRSVSRVRAPRLDQCSRLLFAHTVFRPPLFLRAALLGWLASV